MRMILESLGIYATTPEILALVIMLAIIAYFVGYLRGQIEASNGE